MMSSSWEEVQVVAAVAVAGEARWRRRSVSRGSEATACIDLLL